MPTQNSRQLWEVLRRIAILAVPNCQSLDVVGPLEVFHAATKLQKKQARRDQGYAPFVVGIERRPICSESGLILTPEASLRATLQSAALPVHTFVVAGGLGARKLCGDRTLLKLVRSVAERAERVASVCTGAFLLAASGLLDGRRATTHWAFCEQFARRYPQVEVAHAPIYVRDGNVWTSAGVTAGIDLALALVEEDLGRETALTVARHLVVFVRRAGGQSQFSFQLEAQRAERCALRDLTAFIAERPNSDLSVPALAKRCAMSTRNFSRAFRAELGATPAAYVERVRVEVARAALEQSQADIAHIAAQSGFGTPEALRRAFARRIGISPREYRARFGSAWKGKAS